MEMTPRGSENLLENRERSDAHTTGQCAPSSLEADAAELVHIVESSRINDERSMIRQKDVGYIIIEDAKLLS